MNDDYSTVHEILSACPKLRQLLLRLPYHSPIFLRAVYLIARLNCKTLEVLDLYLNQYPGCTEPSAVDWGQLDSVLQLKKYSRSSHIEIALGWSVRVVAGDVAWGEIYPFLDAIDRSAWGESLKALLPRTLRRQSPPIYFSAYSSEGGAFRWKLLE